MSKKTSSRDDVELSLALLDRTGECVLCHFCRSKIADMEAPRRVPLIESGGPVVRWVELEAGQRLPFLVSGMVWDQEAGLWQLSNNARQQQRVRGVLMYRRRGKPMAPFGYPARVRCPEPACAQVQVLDKEALGVR